ncbi:MAG: small multi-drug export protein [Clostridiales bacterium]|nr:small multi-drug export protein [Clostridiales bacterium]
MLEWLQTIKNEFIVILTAALPLVELKGAIPVGMAMGLGIWESFACSYIGSLLPVPVLLFFFRPIMGYLHKTRILKGFARWIHRRTSQKSQKVHKYSLLGLFIFVAVPLPTTGVWTGSMIASFLKLGIIQSFIAISVGNLVAGLIILLLSHQLI